MCGIFGTLGPESKLLQKYASSMHTLLHHRGPDNQGFTKGDRFALGFNRLAILDLSDSGMQPMHDSSKRYYIVFNGEIFNYRELKETYLPNIKLRGKSDTEVLLHLLMLTKEKALPLLNGMFAFCFIDTKTGNYILGRDRFGIKPFYYTIQQETLYFASELKGLKAIKELPWAIDENALLSYLGNGYITEDSTIYKDYYKLLPASFIQGNIFEKKHSKTPSIYWQLDLTEDYKGTYEDAKVDFEAIFSNAVSIRLRSDVPLGVFLSGGIDSGLVAAFAIKEQPITCYTVGFKEKQFDESLLAKSTAKHIGAEWREINIDKLGLSQIETLAYYYDEPFSDSSVLPSYLICKAGSSEATVFLTGDAGDELFAGYIRYIKRLKYSNFHRYTRTMKFMKGIGFLVPFSWKIKFHKIISQTDLRDAYYDEIPANPWQLSLIQKQHHKKFEQIFIDRVKGFARFTNPTMNQQLFDYEHYLPNDILVKMDRASMANSVEVRSPFLDYRLHEFVAKLPRKWLINNTTGKILLREMAKKYLPNEVVIAEKRGFGIPLNEWTRNSLFLDNLIKDTKHSKIFEEYINLEGFHKFIIAHRNLAIEGGGLVWRLAMLLAWEKKYAI